MTKISHLRWKQERRSNCVTAGDCCRVLLGPKGGGGGVALLHPSNIYWLLGDKHKVHIYLEYHIVCPLVWIGTPPPPLPQACAPHLPGTTEGGRYKLACVWGGGGVPIRTTGEKLSTLSTLWGQVKRPPHSQKHHIFCFSCCTLFSESHQFHWSEPEFLNV
jgi:hypothetical protein